MRFLLLVSLFLTMNYVRGQKLVLPGDFPDPSVVKIGDSYWATATTSNWAPAFPLLESKDLIHWEIKGHVFPQLPGWADYYFWAPEISYDNGKVYVYYSAHKRGGNLCIGVASADRPEGPYTDHGPLMCQEAGSIDAWPMRDNDGKLYLIWKEDGNSVKKPTPIWAAEMNEQRTKLSAEKKELFKNDAAWEANLVEGVSMLKHDGYFYAFYAGAGCCGRGCSYAVGVARAKNLLGPWEKSPKNPLRVTGDEWKCPGHGTPVTKDGKYYFLYHAYNVADDVYPGRQGLLSEFRFDSDGWIEFIDSADGSATIQPQYADAFTDDSLALEWQWSVFNKPDYKLKNGRLHLNAAVDPPAFLGSKTYTGDYVAEVSLFPRESSSDAGIALAGDGKNFVSLTFKDRSLALRKVEQNKETIIAEKEIGTAKKIFLRISVEKGKDITFHWSTNGKSYSALNDEPVDGTFLPPWDRAVRVALVSKGQSTEEAVFDDFSLKTK